MEGGGWAYRSPPPEGGWCAFAPLLRSQCISSIIQINIPSLVCSKIQWLMYFLFYGLLYRYQAPQAASVISSSSSTTLTSESQSFCPSQGQRSSAAYPPFGGPVPTSPWHASVLYTEMIQCAQSRHGKIWCLDSLCKCYFWKIPLETMHSALFSCGLSVSQYVISWNQITHRENCLVVLHS